MRWYRETFRATVVLLAASVCLVVPARAGLGGSVWLGAALAGLAVGLARAREALGAAPTVAGHDLGAYGSVLWIGAAVAGAVCLGARGTTPAELQALGGLVGLAGMANYFLRPLYRLGYGLWASLVRAG